MTMEWYVITALVILGVSFIVGMFFMLRRSYRVINIAAENYKRRADAYSGIEDDDPEEYEHTPGAGGSLGMIIGAMITIIAVTQVVWPVMDDAVQQATNVTGGVGGTAETILGVMPIIMVAALAMLVVLANIVFSITGNSDEEEGSTEKGRDPLQAESGRI